MANFTWQYDAPSGVYKSHEMSSAMRVAAIAETRIMQFVKPEPGYGKKKGDTITITRLSNTPVPTSGRLVEGIRIPEDALTLTTVAISVSEWGRSIPFTSYAEDLSMFNMENMVQKALRNQMAITMDNAAAAAFKTTSVKVCAIPDGVASLVFDTDGTPSTLALANLNFYHVEQIRDYMKTTLVVPAYEGGDYVCLASTKALRGLKRDPAFETWHKYTDNEAKFTGEVGKIEGVRFVEINNTGALSGSVGSGGVLGEALFLGEDGVVMAVAQDPELRAGIPGDFGRQKAIAWYGILDFGIVWDTANSGEARVVRLTSS